MTIAIYPGSFDPFTYGHLDILRDSAKLFDKVIIAVGYNSEKNGLIPVEDRVQLIRDCINVFDNVDVTSYSGLTVEFAKANNAEVMIRGLRNTIDFEYEKNLANINSKLDNGIKTMFLLANPEHSEISSSAIRELVKYHKDLTQFVPKNVQEYIYKITR